MYHPFEQPEPFEEQSGEAQTSAELASSDLGEEQRVVVFEKLVDWLIETDPWKVRRYVQSLRERYPDASDDELVEKVVSVKSVKNGLIGAATAVPGFLALPIVVPADLIASWKIQINLALCIAHIYGHEIDGHNVAKIKTDLFMILAGEEARESFEVMGVEVDQVTQETVRRYVTREIAIELWKHLGLRIMRMTGVRSFARLSKAVPLVGAPIGFVFDYSATRTVGEAAREYYSPQQSAA